MTHASLPSCAGQSSTGEPSAQDLKQSRDRGLYGAEFPGTAAGVATSVAPRRSPAAPRPAGHLARTPSAFKKAAAQGKGQPARTAKTSPAKDPATASAAASADQLIPVSHTVTASPVVIRASLNKPGAKPSYRLGEKLRLDVTSSADCNIVIFDYDSQGILTQVFPNKYQQDSLVRAGETVTIGGPQSDFDFVVSGTGGAEKIFVYAYPAASENPLTIAFNPAQSGTFRTATMTAEQYRQLVSGSRVFFSRGVKVVGRSQADQAKPAADSAPNKIELTYTVEP